MPRKVERWKPPTMIYAARRSDGIVKIGSTQNVEFRLNQLSREYGMTYLRERTWDIPGGWANHIEQRVHAALKPHRVDMGDGSREHYQVSIGVIADAIAACGDPSKWRLNPVAAARSPEAVAERLRLAIKRMVGPISAGHVTIEEAAKRLGCDVTAVQRGIDEFWVNRVLWTPEADGTSYTVLEPQEGDKPHHVRVASDDGQKARYSATKFAALGTEAAEAAKEQS